MRGNRAASAAGSIQQDPVKAIEFLQLPCVLLQDGHPGRALPGKIEPQAPGPSGIAFTGGNQGPIACQRRHLRRLSARRRCHIQNIFPGKGIQQKRRNHGGEALQINAARFIHRQCLDPLFHTCIEKKCVAVPGNPFKADARLCQHFLCLPGIRAERVHPKAGPAPAGIAGPDSLKFLRAILPLKLFHQKIESFHFLSPFFLRLCLLLYHSVSPERNWKQAASFRSGGVIIVRISFCVLYILLLFIALFMSLSLKVELYLFFPFLFSALLIYFSLSEKKQRLLFKEEELP